MSRSGSRPPEDDDRILPDGLFTQEEEALLKTIAGSEQWRLIEDALILEREALFAGTSCIDGLSGQPKATEELWRNRGAILIIQHLLQEGPLFVIRYRRYLSDKQAPKKVRRKKRPPVKAKEREYDARAGLHDGPDFGEL